MDRARGDRRQDAGQPPPHSAPRLVSGNSFLDYLMRARSIATRSPTVDSVWRLRRLGGAGGGMAASWDALVSCYLLDVPLGFVGGIAAVVEDLFGRPLD